MVGLVHLVSSHIMAFCVRADEIMANITRYFKQLASLVAIVCSKLRYRKAKPDTLRLFYPEATLNTKTSQIFGKERL